MPKGMPVLRGAGGFSMDSGDGAAIVPEPAVTCYAHSPRSADKISQTYALSRASGLRSHHHHHHHHVRLPYIYIFEQKQNLRISSLIINQIK